MSTLVETINANFADNTMPVLSNDPLTTIGTDFIFDAFNPAGYASGALPANGAAVSSLVNLSRTQAPGIPFTSREVRAATALTPAKPPTFDNAKGWVFTPVAASKDAFVVTRGEAINGRVIEPSFEGFKEFVMICWYRLAAVPAGLTGLFAAGQSGGSNPNGGLVIFATGNVTETINSQYIAGPGLNVLAQVAVAYKFNTGSNTTELKTFNNGALTGTYVGRVPTGYVTNNAAAGTLIGGGVGYSANAPINGSICRVVREFNGISNMTSDAFVARDYSLNLARLTAGV